MGYYRDLKKISIKKYKRILNKMDLLPSWSILENDIDKNLDLIKKQNIHNLEELVMVLKTKNKLEDFSLKSGLSIQYLNVLRRVVNGYRPKPNRIIDFPNINENVVKGLATIGIKNTLQLYDKVLVSKQRKELSKQTGVPLKQITELTRLTDLSRIKWVNHTFAHVLLESGYRSAQEVANANYEEMYERIRKLNAERNFYKGNMTNIAV